MSGDDGRSPSSGSDETDAQGSDGSGDDGGSWERPDSAKSGPEPPDADRSADAGESGGGAGRADGDGAERADGDGTERADGDGTERGTVEAERSTVDGRAGAPRRESGGTSRQSPLRRLLSAERGPLMVVREIGVSVVTVALIGLLLFGLSGVWPPMVAVESGSMEPHMHRGDLVFVSEPGRYVPDDAANGRGVITRTEGERIGYRTFGGYGSVVVYDSPGRGGPPVIHRAHFWVTEGENWYDEANPAYHDADDCQELRNCPAPHAGFITKGDANSGYDQVLGISSPVRPGWVVGIAQVRVPYLGYVRLWLAEGSAGPLVVEHVGDGASGPAVVGVSAGSDGRVANVTSDGRTTERSRVAG